MTNVSNFTLPLMSAGRPADENRQNLDILLFIASASPVEIISSMPLESEKFPALVNYTMNVWSFT